MKKTLFFITVLLPLSVMFAQTEEKLRSDFKSPPLDHRMNVNQHALSTNPIAQEDYFNITLKKNGYGGLNTNVAHQNYLDSEVNFAAFCQGVRSAKNKGYDVWLYDEKLYPSGMADEKILTDHPEWEAEGLLIYKTNLNAKETAQMKMLGSLILAKAIPYVDGEIQYDQEVDISDSFTDGELKWTPASGSWRVVTITRDVLYEGYQAGTERGGQYPRYPSLMMPEVTNLFVEYTHKRYEKAFGEKLGKYFTATFTDEPSTMALPYQKLGYGVFPWKENVSDEFKKRYGYELNDKLVKITLDKGDEGKKLRYQYFKIIADFMSQNYLKILKDYCHSQGFLSSGHFLLEECLVTHAPLYGDIMACFRELDIPGIDALTGLTYKTRSYMFSTRLAASVAELNGGFRVMYESCPIDNDLPNMAEPPALDVKGVHNRIMVGGVTDYNNYLKLTNETYESRTLFNDYMARVVSMLYGGTRASRVVVYYPIETVWTKFRPNDMCLSTWWSATGADAEVHTMENLIHNVTYSLIDNGWEYSYIDAKGLAESTVSGHSLRHGDNLKWDVIVLPYVETIPKAAYDKLVEFVNNGGKVIALNKIPVNSETEYPSEEISNQFQKFADESAIIYNKTFNSNTFNEQLESILKRDIVMSEYKGMMYSHKVVNNKDVYFIINDEKVDKTISISLPSTSSWELWDPQTGDVKPIGASFNHTFSTFDGIIIRSTNDVNSILSKVSDNRLQLFPNPTNGLLNFNISTENIGDVRVVDMLGNTVRYEKDKQSQIDLSTLHAGIYIVQIKMDNRTYSSIIQKI